MIRGEYPKHWKLIAQDVKEKAGWKCIRCGYPHEVESGHVLTVHHFNGDKSNCEWWNLLALECRPDGSMDEFHWEQQGADSHDYKNGKIKDQ